MAFRLSINIRLSRYRHTAFLFSRLSNKNTLKKIESSLHRSLLELQQGSNNSTSKMLRFYEIEF